MSSLVSVVLPTYNRAYCIARTLESVLAQSHRNLEVLVVDDGSTDGTEALIQQKFSHDPRLHYFYQPNQGVSVARNFGIRTARGNFLALVDSDDVWLPWKIEIQLRCLKRFLHAGMIWTDMLARDPQGNVFSERYLRTMYGAYRWFTNEQLFSESALLRDFVPDPPPELAGGRLYFGDIYSQMIMGNLVHTPTVLLRRERLEKVGFFDESMRFAGEDFDFHIRTCSEGPVAFLDLASIEYQVGRQDQITRPSNMINFAESLLKTIGPRIERERNRINLPDSMIRNIMAFANSWLGVELVGNGQTRRARHYLAASLRYRLWQPQIAVFLLLSYLPANVAETVRRLYRSLRFQRDTEKAAQPLAPR